MTRLDLAIQKHPDHADGIRLFGERDPAGNLKYLDWQLRVLVSGQALAPEIADVVDLFHKYKNVRADRRRRDGVRHDLYSYRPQDLASLRTALLKRKRAAERKIKQRERLYKIEGTVEADVLYESPDLVVRHVRNKQASAHYGRSTKWCIAMTREGYFDDYDTHNAVFFFVERTTPQHDEYDKSCILVGRGEYVEGLQCFNALDIQVDPMQLAKAYGRRIFHILDLIYARSESYPGSFTARLFAGTATAEQLQQVFATERDNARVTEAVCCNDAAPWSILERVVRLVSKKKTEKKTREARRRRRRRHRRPHSAMAALSIHPNVPTEVREQLSKKLRQRHVLTDTIRIEKSYDGVGVVYRMRGESMTVPGHERRRVHQVARHLRHFSLSELVRRVGMFQNMVKRTKKAVQKKRREIAAKKKRKRR